MQNQGLRASLTIDRATASRLGITPQMIDDTLYDAFGQRQVSTIFTQLNQYRVVLEVKPDFQRQPRPISMRSISAAPSGGQVPLSAIARISETTGPLVISHQGQFPVVTLSFNLAPGVSLGQAVEGDRRGHGANGAAGKHPGQLPGNGRRPSRPRCPTSRC